MSTGFDDIVIKQLSFSVLREPGLSQAPAKLSLIYFEGVRFYPIPLYFGQSRGIQIIKT